MSIDSRPATRCSAMRLSSWFLCPTLRLLPEASHQVRNRLLFRVARTARKRGVGFVLRAQREPLPPLEAFGVELAWVSCGPPMARFAGSSIMRPAACGKAGRVFPLGVYGGEVLCRGKG